MTATVLLCLLAAAVSGGSGYFISLKFNSTNYAATDKSGDFGTPRGSFFALMAGCIIGMGLMSLLSHVPGVAPDAIGPAMIVSMIVGAVAGVAGMFAGQKTRKGGGNDNNKSS